MITWILGAITLSAVAVAIGSFTAKVVNADTWIDWARRYGWISPSEYKQLQEDNKEKQERIADLESSNISFASASEKAINALLAHIAMLKSQGAANEAL